jgi:3-oxoadipate enol-lactonase
MMKARINNIEIAYKIDGSGDPVILIGGFGMVKEGWLQQVTDLEKHFRIITFDNRGVGESTVPKEAFTIADMAADVIGMMDEIGIGTAGIFGVSMGGLITQTLALDYPDRVKKAVLGCTSHGGRHAIQPQQEVMELLASIGDPNMDPEVAARKRAPIMFSERFMREEPERMEQYMQMSLGYQPTPQGAAGQMQALSFFNVKRRLGEIRCPVLVITGDEDRMMPPGNAQLLADGIPGAELYVVKGAEHGFFQEKPEEVNRVLIDFFKK